MAKSADEDYPRHDEVYCASCGEIIKEAAEFCPECGVSRDTSASTSRDGAPSLIPVVLLGGLWVLTAFVFWLWFTDSTIWGLAVWPLLLISIPLMYIDAKNASQYDRYSIDYPSLWVAANLLVGWVIGTPFYVIYRLVKQ